MLLNKEENNKLYDVVGYGHDFYVVEELLAEIVGNDVKTFVELKERLQPVYEEIKEHGGYYDYPLECDNIYQKRPLFYLDEMIKNNPHWFAEEGMNAEQILYEGVNMVLTDVVEKIMGAD